MLLWIIWIWIGIALIVGVTVLALMLFDLTDDPPY
jgi:hypothetical protein